MRRRRAVEHVRVVRERAQDGQPVDGFLLVEGLVGAYVVDEGHGGIVRAQRWWCNGAGHT